MSEVPLSGLRIYRVVLAVQLDHDEKALAVQCKGWRVEGGGWRVEGGGWRVESEGCRVQGAGCKVQGVGCRVCDHPQSRGGRGRDGDQRTHSDGLCQYLPSEKKLLPTLLLPRLLVFIPFTSSL